MQKLTLQRKIDESCDSLSGVKDGKNSGRQVQRSSVQVAVTGEHRVPINVIWKRLRSVVASAVRNRKPNVLIILTAVPLRPGYADFIQSQMVDDTVQTPDLFLALGQRQTR